MTRLALHGQHLRLAYDDTAVVHDCSITLTPGRVTALVGPNGSGKSTLLRALARLHPVSSGEVQLAGHGAGAGGFGGADDLAGPDSHTPTEDARALSARAFAQRLSMLTQHRPTPAGMTVAEVVTLGRHPHKGRFFGGDPDGAERVARALRLTQLTDLAHRFVDSLSGGQAQRVWLASCLAQDTPIILLDEPTNHLDLRHQIELLALLRSLADDHGATLGVVLHDLNQAAAIADEVILLCEGRIVAQGPPAAVFTADELTTAYGVSVDVSCDAAGALRVCALGGVRRRTLAATA